MDPARLAEIEALLEAAEQRPIDERADFLMEACDDAQIRQEVAKHLAGDEAAASFFDGVADRLAAVASDALDGGHIARQFGPYQTVRLVGHGGMGSVYEAQRADGQFEQRVAIKLIRRGMETEVAVARFVAERQILARLQHPGIARLLDGGLSEDDRPYFVLELIDGRPLHEHCAAERLDVEARLRLVLQIADAVAYAHRNLVVHRDLKPSNVLVDRAGQTKLLDFGIAKPLAEGSELTRTGGRAMTPVYAAPEQIRGETITTATDVYGLGLILYELLTGRRAYGQTTGSAGELERQILHDDPARPSVAVRQSPPSRDGEDTPSAAQVADTFATTPTRLARRLAGDLDTICAMALRKEPERRYASARALAEDIRRHLQGDPVRARADSLGYRTSKFLRRHRFGAAVVFAAVVVTAVFVVSLVRQVRQTQIERDRAEAVSDLLIELLVEADPELHRGHELTAREVLDRGAARVEAMHDRPLIQMRLADVMGQAYRNLGAYESADRMLRLTLRLRREQLGTEDVRTADAERELAELLRLRGDYEDAATTVEHALQIHRGAGARESEAADLAVLARLHHARGQYADAEAEARQALATLRDTVGPEDARVADVLNDLAATLDALGRGDEASATYREALALQREVLGEDHPAIPATLNNLARVLSRGGDLEAAEVAQRQALAIYHRVHGDDGRHPALATTLSNLGTIRMMRGDPAQAEGLLSDALQMRRSLLGPDHTDVAQTASTLGLLLQQAGRRDDAEPLLRDALRIREATLPAGHTAIAISLNNLALLLHDTGALTEAESLLRRALAVASDGDGQEAGHVATCRNNLGAVLVDAGKLDAADREYDAALTWRRAHLPPDHPYLAYALLGRGRIACAQGHVADGEAWVREALQIREAKLPDEHWEIAEARAELGHCLLAKGEVTRGRELLASAHTTLRTHRGSDDRRTRRAAPPAGTVMP